ncbi:hypothetical protein QL285_040812 [Trifolium repens]|nr:hypothetical protein QL285_040812 [Trifolium repens]
MVVCWSGWSFSDGCRSAAAAFVAFWCYDARWYCYGGGAWWHLRTTVTILLPSPTGWISSCSDFPAVQISLLHVFILLGFGCLSSLVFARCWPVALASDCVLFRSWAVFLGVGGGAVGGGSSELDLEFLDPVLWSLGGWSEWGLSSDSGGVFSQGGGDKVMRLGVVPRWFSGCWIGGVGLLVWWRLVSRGWRCVLAEVVFGSGGGGLRWWFG